MFAVGNRWASSLSGLAFHLNLSAHRSMKEHLPGRFKKSHGTYAIGLLSDKTASSCS